MTLDHPIVYLTTAEIERFNQEILRRAGQPTALLRDRALLESAAQRPQTAAYYAGADIITQAALYMVGIAMNHPFLDGNKRTGYVSGMTFLQLNGVAVADARFNDAELGAWLEQAVTHQITHEVFVERLRQRLTDEESPHE